MVNNARGLGPGNRPNYYEGIGLDFAGKEQRFGWMLDDTELAKNIEEIKQSIARPVQSISQPIALSSLGEQSQSLDCTELNIIRCVLTVPTGITSIALEGYDGFAWFYFCNRPYTFISQGIYSIIIEPVMALQLRISLLQGSGPITVQLLGK